ncbi:leucine-rich repeat protein [Mycoplasma sp. CSL7475-4]|uniref:leucine-rich repeat protein n=1 Tax=Mycoplasma sp. CSL7475-4 TaxID=2973942 RepID=UPI00216B2E80|nr:leucine-rich repeat protein [Mycoplasma sp. CSL7475-4]MCS4536833.1 leucine-rich repeat protein [Mycoplasma sp. CSL7475-4]
MKKNKLILLGFSFVSIPFVAAACSNNNKKTQSNEENKQEIAKSEFDIEKEKLQKIIEDAQIKHKSYSSEEGNEAFSKSGEGITEATKAFHEAQTVEQLIQAGQKLKKIIEETEKYNNLTIDEKRQLVKDKFNEKLNKAKSILGQLTKPDAIELLQTTINTSEAISEDDLRYYNKLIKATTNIELVIENSLNLDKKSNKELYELYLGRESRIMNNFEREFGNSEIYLDIQNKIRSLFTTEKDADKSSYTEQIYAQKEADLKRQINEILLDVKTTTLTKNAALTLYDSEITSLQLLPEIKYIQQDAFKDYFELENIVFNDKLETIDQGAFANTKISSLTLPQSLKKISGFEKTPIKELILPQNVEIVEFAFNNANNLNKLLLNEGLRELSGFNETSITSLNLPASLTKFYGFRNSLINELSLPASLTTFVTYLPELTTLSIPAEFNLDLITTDTSSTNGIVISSELFPKIENIFVQNEEQKTKLKELLSTNIEIENEDEIRSEIESLENTKSERIRSLQLYISYLQNIATIAIDNYPNISEQAKHELIELAQPESNDDNSVIAEIKNYLIDYKYAWTTNKKLTDIDENIIALKKVINLAGYELNAEKINNDDKLKEETRTNYIAEDEKYNNNKKDYDGIESKISKLNELIKKYREVVKNSEYYIQYLNLIAKYKVLHKIQTLTDEQKNAIKKLINLSINEIDEELTNKLSDFIFVRKYNSHDTLINTQRKIDELIALINVVNFELTDENIAAQTEEELPNEDSIKSEFELEKNRFEGSKVNKWNDIIKIK